MRLILFAAALGASMQEIAHWYLLKRRLNAARYRAILASPGYWTATIVMVAASAAGTWLWYYPELPTTRTALLTGAAFPVLVKKGLALVAGHQAEAAAASGGFSFREYLKGA
jgi:hypothetical protein